MDVPFQSIENSTAATKKAKKRTKSAGEELNVKNPKQSKNNPRTDSKPAKFTKSTKKFDPPNPNGAKSKKLISKPDDKGAKNQWKPTEKVEDWKKFKKEKQELKVKRVKARTKDNFDRIQQAKKMGERVRLKTLKEEDRNKIINQLHSLLKGNYCKFVLAHDTARIVQSLLKYASKIVVQQISQELIPIATSMLQSKYGIYCIKRLLKYGDDDIRSSVIEQMKGYTVKLASHVVSAPVVEFAFSNYATPTQKQFLTQEFYGDLYKNSKDANVKHIRDVYRDNENMKIATLSACKANIKKVLNKALLDSGLVQVVLSQYLEECSVNDRAELITELVPHIVVISNSKEGSKAAMQCIWHGTAKDKKVIMKSLKEHLIELAKHEFGHRTVICLLDSVDDTVLLHKIILTEILSKAKDLAVSEYGRKVLLWLVAATESTIFHPQFIKELTSGKETSSSKKPAETRRNEILQYSCNSLLNLVIEDTKFWLSNGSLALEMAAIIKAGSGDILKETLSKVVETILQPDWKIRDTDKEVIGIEDAGIHMTLKKLAQHDKVALEQGKATFGATLVDALSSDILTSWLKVNRGCFLLVAVWENSDDTVQGKLKLLLQPHLSLLKKQKTSGANILLKKM
ncbi:protein penguin [Euwallacea fornicatus]|uniref:protein penguin n=1 Tax=Euwallacea fornicatus TaxID=995702 RepID=UPI00338FBAD7